MSPTNQELDADTAAELSYLRRRVAEEANAAVVARSTDTTLIHVALALAYAKRFGEQSRAPQLSNRASWADQHRLW
jgi:hypothetical protein